MGLEEGEVGLDGRGGMARGEGRRDQKRGEAGLKGRRGRGCSVWCFYLTGKLNCVRYMYMYGVQWQHQLQGMYSCLLVHYSGEFSGVL